MQGRRIMWMLGLGALILGPAASGFGMKVEAGQWRMEQTSTNSLMPEPTTEVAERCLTEHEITPDALMAGAKECKFEDIVSTDSEMSWKMRCDTRDGLMTGNAEFTSTGSEMRGKMQMEMKAGERSISVEHSWVGKHQGPCP